MQRLLLLSACAAVVTLGCAGATDGSDDGGADDVAIEGGGTAADAADAPADAADVPNPCPTPTLELGTNAGPAPVPSSFVPFVDGGEAKVELGPQGLWMVVVAFRSCGLYQAPLLLDAQIATDDGLAQGKLKLGKQKWVPSGTVWDYYYNFWLVVQNPEHADGKMATLSLGVSDAKGAAGTHKVRLRLVGGPK